MKYFQVLLSNHINLGHYTKAKIEFPELNVSGDVYRIGTLLELIREVATKLSAVGLLLTIIVGQYTIMGHVAYINSVRWPYYHHTSLFGECHKLCFIGVKLK